MKRILLLLMVMLIAVACQPKPGPQPDASATPATESGQAGELAPRFELNGPDGSPVVFAPDKIVNDEVHLLLFWSFLWDPNVQTFMERAGELHERYSPRGLNIIAISFDKDPDALRNYLTEHKSPFPIAVGTSKTFEDFQLEAVPTSILVDKDGRVRERWEGYFSTEEQADTITPYLPGRTGN